MPKKKRVIRTSHVLPRRILSATQEQLDRWDEAAKRGGKTWADWVRGLLDAAAPPPPKDPDE